MGNRFLAALSIGALVCVASPTKAYQSTRVELITFGNGQLHYDNHSNASLFRCKRNATWLRKKLNLNTPSSHAFCIKYTEHLNQRGPYELYITSQNPDLIPPIPLFLSVYLRDCKRIGAEITTELNRNTAIKTWKYKCLKVS